MDPLASQASLRALTADIVGAHVAHNSVATSDLPAMIGNVYAALASLGTVASSPAQHEQGPAVSIRASIKPDYLVCLEDGKKLKMLKRHLMTSYGLTPDAYRAKWKLPADYPMVPPNYAATRRTLALKFGLGRKNAPVAAPEPVVPKVARARRATLRVADPSPEAEPA